MNKLLRSILLLTLVMGTVLLLASCKTVENPYEKNEENGYTINVRYDANGGSFATNTSVIVDSYNPEDFPSGKLPLIAPENELRAPEKIAFNNGFILAGWYTERTPVLDENGNHLDYNGNIAKESGMAPAYTFSGHWNFDSDRLDISTLDGNTVTLYAAWIPEFYFEFYDITTGELIGSRLAGLGASIKLPSWNLATGRMDKNDFPELVGMTYDKVYTDAKGNNPVDSDSIIHTGVIDYATATATGGTMKIYVDTLEGSWFKISTADQLISNANPTAHYILTDDLDFTGKSWPLSGTFTGSIIGNGHKISGITAKQSSQSQQAGLFGTIAESAKITDVSFENVSYTIAKGSRNAGPSYGLFAGKINQGATLTNVSVSGKLIISSEALNGSMTKDNGDHVIGLVCGTGYEHCNIDYSAITVEALNEGTRYTVTVSSNGNEVSWVREKVKASA